MAKSIKFDNDVYLDASSVCVGNGHIALNTYLTRMTKTKTVSISAVNNQKSYSLGLKIGDCDVISVITTDRYEWSFNLTTLSVPTGNEWAIIFSEQPTGEFTFRVRYTEV